ncbi:hypothetical protein ES708_20119 [subsurface metagenome]
MSESLRIDNFRLCAYCHKCPSLGRTIIGWLGCVVCQREVDTAMEEFVKEKFGSR